MRKPMASLLRLWDKQWICALNQKQRKTAGVLAYFRSLAYVRFKAPNIQKTHTLYTLRILNATCRLILPLRTVFSRAAILHRSPKKFGRGDVLRSAAGIGGPNSL